MKNKTMLEIAIEVISSDTSRSFTFDEIFQRIEEELREVWIQSYEDDENFTLDKIKEKKMGELYRLLTVDMRFTRNLDGTWISSTTEIN
ncbi:hypothetical protein JXZ92_00970 [Mycoplasma sp. CSL10137]|uniref:DNA-directed RNA polymerase subunit delta n=1 Tax=unclassified Mycoplasma TaxID=2683645 RepID=UPI00197B764A|nr:MULTISPECIES: hypothetical protein [unclassified Mycoplasma]MBN4083395.1 hypothetical protein [Mycoplasma sp. CSL10137]MBN4084303.1 hypothetical protein [Mycoplasma sp. CSL10166]MBU4692775.1 hypothetical protein [Mycoplasma sp. CSL7491-lung]